VPLRSSLIRHRSGLVSRLASHIELWVTQPNPTRFGRRKRRFGPNANERALFLSESGKQMQDERINVSPKFSDHEGHLVSHQAADEMNVATEPVQLRYAYRAAPTSRFRQRSD
jgi:hypothetical protein